MDQLYELALAIRYERHIGDWLPKIQLLALRGHSDAMVELADWHSDHDNADNLGKPANLYGAAGLYYRAYRKGNARAAHNAAMSCFNRNDMAGYRTWLRRAANAGDPAAALQLRHFETRLPHNSARKVRRLRPEQKRDEFA